MDNYKNVTITDQSSVSLKGHSIDVQVQKSGGFGFVPVLQGILAVTGDTVIQIQITDLIIDEENYNDVKDFDSKMLIVVDGEKFHNCRRIGGGLSPAEIVDGNKVLANTVIYRGYIYYG